MTERGSKHPCWKGGRIIINGYIAIWKLDHPFASLKGYVYEHRLIYEQYYNCCLLPWIVIHHIDGNIQNNKIENLRPMLRGQHSLIHNIGNKNSKKDLSNRFCLLCKSKTTLIYKYGYFVWVKYEDGFICNKCRMKVYKNPLSFR
jgi:hypothetical protein